MEADYGGKEKEDAGGMSGMPYSHSQWNNQTTILK
jgi:hypothetical protein